VASWGEASLTPKPNPIIGAVAQLRGYPPPWTSSLDEAASRPARRCGRVVRTGGRAQNATTLLLVRYRFYQMVAAGAGYGEQAADRRGCPRPPVSPGSPAKSGMAWPTRRQQALALNATADR